MLRDFNSRRTFVSSLREKQLTAGELLIYCFEKTDDPIATFLERETVANSAMNLSL